MGSLAALPRGHATGDLEALELVEVELGHLLRHALEHRNDRAIGQALGVVERAALDLRDQLGRLVLLLGVVDPREDQAVLAVAAGRRRGAARLARRAPRRGALRRASARRGRGGRLAAPTS